MVACIYAVCSLTKGSASVHWCLSKNENRQEPIEEPNKPLPSEFWGRKEAVQRVSREAD